MNSKIDYIGPFPNLQQINTVYSYYLVNKFSILRISMVGLLPQYPMFYVK